MNSNNRSFDPWLVSGSGSVDSQEHRNRAAEETARNRRLDRDALIAAALQRFESSAIEAAGSSLNANVWIAFYASFTGRTLKADDVAGLLAEIRSELSPLVNR